MTNEALERAVREALDAIEQPGTSGSVLSSEAVRELRIDEDGTVRFAFHLRPEDPGTLVKQVRSAVEGIDGVSKVRVTCPRTSP